MSGTFPNPGFAVDMATQAELDALQAEVDALELTDFRYVHIQSTPSASWVINHNLGTYPDVEVIDSSGAAVLATVDHPDANNTVISFIGATAGRAILS